MSVSEGDFSDGEDQKLGTLLHQGARVLVKHDHYFGSGFLDSKWQGLFHLAYIEKGWNEDDQSFTIRWSRNGESDSHDLTYRKDIEIKPFRQNKKVPLQIEDDRPTDNIHTAHFVNFPEDTSKITIKWDTHKVEEISLSRVCFGAGTRKRRATDFYKDEGTPRLGSSTKKMRASVKKETRMRKPKTNKMANKEVIDLLSTSSDDSSVDKSAKKPSFIEVQQKLPMSDSSDDDSCAKSDGTSSKEGMNHHPTPLSCKGSARMAQKCYKDDSSAASFNGDAGRKLDMESLSSTSDSDKNITINSRSKPRQSRSSRNIVLRGYTVSSKQAIKSGAGMKKKYGGESNANNFEENLSSMLQSLQACDDDKCEEYYDLLVDMNMYIQEKLFKIKDKTTLSVPQPLDERKEESCQYRNDGNMPIIVNLARENGLSKADIDNLFADLSEDEHGYYSINDAVLKIDEMKKINAPGANQDDELLLSGLVHPFSDLIGKRIKSVLEDGIEYDGTVDSVQFEVDYDDGTTNSLDEVISKMPGNSIADIADCVGTRVITDFGDDGAYEGTIQSVNFRIRYDDGDTETFDQREIFERLVDNPEELFDRKTSGTMLELFSGCSLLSTHCKRKGMIALSVDNDQNSNAGIKADFNGEYVQDILSAKIFDYIHASPVCSSYSRLAGNLHRDRDNYNKSEASHEADKTLSRLYLNFKSQLKRNPDCIITIENPSGWMKEGNIMKCLIEAELGFKMYQIYYCQFGRDDMKPTCIWTNDHRLGEILLSYGGKCKCEGNHKESVRNTPGKNFAALPDALCKIISSYVDSNIRQRKFDKLRTK